MYNSEKEQMLSVDCKYYIRNHVGDKNSHSSSSDRENMNWLFL